MANSMPLDSSPPPTIESLKGEIDQLKQQQERESHEFWGRTKRWGLVIALIGGLIAISRGIYDSSVQLWGEPKTDVSGGDSLDLIVDPTAETVTFSLEALITNEGKKDDVISQLTGKVLNESSPSGNYLPLARTDFNCFSQGVRLLTRFSVRKDVPLPVNCSIVAMVSNASREPFLDAGNYHLKINLLGRNQKEYHLDYCFQLSEKDLQEIFASQTAQKRRFLDAVCR